MCFPFIFRSIVFCDIVRRSFVRIYFSFCAATVICYYDINILLDCRADTLCKKIGKVFDIKASFMISDIKCNLADNAGTLKSDIENSTIALKSDLKADIENSASALKLDMSNKIKVSHDDLMWHVGFFAVKNLFFSWASHRPRLNSRCRDLNLIFRHFAH